MAEANHDMSTECGTGETPVPLNGIFRRETPLLERDKLPERAPDVIGVNTMVALTL